MWPKKKHTTDDDGRRDGVGRTGDFVEDGDSGWFGGRRFGGGNLPPNAYTLSVRYDDGMMMDTCTQDSGLEPNNDDRPHWQWFYGLTEAEAPDPGRISETWVRYFSGAVLR